MITQMQLKLALHYNPDTGAFTWLPHNKQNWNARYAGTEAGSKNDNGYLIISVYGRSFRAHRLAWLYMYGEWPKGDIDHINRDRLDNRISNLRSVDRSQNLKNRKARVGGVIGVHQIKGTNLYHVQYVDDDGVKHQKKTLDFFEAVCIRKSAENRLESYLT